MRDGNKTVLRQPRGEEAAQGQRAVITLEDRLKCGNYDKMIEHQGEHIHQ